MPDFRGIRITACRMGILLWLCTCAQGVTAAEQMALLMPRAAQGLLLDVARAGPRLVAVGERGHALVSDDDGRSWTQARVPTRAMLTALWFADERIGWAVGHDGVVLITRDGGRNWELQRNGLEAQRGFDEQAVQAARARLETLQSAASADAAAIEEARFALEDAEATLAEPVFAPPLFDLRFSDALSGIAVGAYGSCIVTADGGATWSDARARFDNPDQNHLYAIADVGGRLLVAGESGQMFRSDDGGASWDTVDTGHRGTFFGLLALPDARAVYAFGLQGAVLLSEDAGQGWRVLDAGTAVVLAGATLDAAGVPWIVGSVGTLLRAHGERIEPLPATARRAHLSAVVTAADGVLVVVGQGGAERIEPRRDITSAGR